LRSQAYLLVILVGPRLAWSKDRAGDRVADGAAIGAGIAVDLIINRRFFAAGLH